MKLAFVFPGQGSQAVGMGSELAAAVPAARHLFEEVDEALKQDLARLMFKGPEEALILTENAQPALLAVSLALVRALEEEGGLDLGRTCAFLAGHSLGEYSALAAARAVTVADAARLVKRRGQAMQRAVPVGEGAMAALLGLDLEAAAEVVEAAAGDEVCALANDNAPGQVVVSGTRAAVERAVEIAAERGARHAVMLPVSAPFHCPLMQPAADEMAEALEAVEILPPLVPIVANVTAATVSDPAAIRALLVEQMTARVRWRESVLYLREHDVDTLVEVGAGKVLSGLARRIDPELARLTLQTPHDLDTFFNHL